MKHTEIRPSDDISYVIKNAACFIFRHAAFIEIGSVIVQIRLFFLVLFLYLPIIGNTFSNTENGYKEQHNDKYENDNSSRLHGFLLSVKVLPPLTIFIILYVRNKVKYFLQFFLRSLIK